MAEAQALRLRAAVPPVSDSTVVVEAEELQVATPATPGWRALPFGTNYYAATLANTFLSRQAYLGAAEQGPTTEAGVDFRVPRAGRYLALVRYEAAYRFETQFRLRIEQDGKTLLDRLYGARDNVKVWAFGKGVAREVHNDWGGADSIVWEGLDAYVDLKPGAAHLTLVAGEQPEPAARRNVDAIVLTSDEADVRARLAKEPYLPLDGMLTQAGDVFLRVRNSSGPFQLHVPPGTEHSPYWVHVRGWKAIDVAVDSRGSTEWVEVGSLLDSLNGGQWDLTATSKGDVSFDLDLGVRDEYGRVEVLRTFRGGKGVLRLAYFGDTRYSRRILTQDEVLDELLGYLNRNPVSGNAPALTPIYAQTFAPIPGDPSYESKIDEFARLMGLNRMGSNASRAIDLRGLSTPKLQAACNKLRASMDPAAMEVVSMGDEIALPEPPANASAAFRQWLRRQNVAPSDVDPASAGRYEKLAYDPSEEAARRTPSLYFYSKRFAFHYGAQALKEQTDVVHAAFPNAMIGANFSPHRGHLYLGDTHQWITAFREGGLTMPWGEDYVFQVPVGSPQVNLLAVDIFRAAVRNRPDARIEYYVMAHDPGNTPGDWRRLFYGDLAHGVKIVNLYELRPLQASYTENHVDAPEMYQAVRVALHELGTFEDLVQAGSVRRGAAALWFSEVADVWDDKRAPFDAHERALYLMLRHEQVPLDVVVEGDDLGGYAALFLTDRHVSVAAAKAIAAWVERGGQLVASAGAGMLDEFDRPNTTLRRLLGVDPGPAETDARGVVSLEKQDLPFASPMDHVHTSGGETLPVLSLRVPVTSRGAEVVGRFDDGSPAITLRRAGKGTARYVGFLPALTYLLPAFPRKPFDRRSDDSAMCHLLPTVFDESAARVMAVDVPRPVVASERLVESTVLQSPAGALIPLVNWSGKRIEGLRVTVRIPLPSQTVSLASGGRVRSEVHGAETTLTLDLDVADAILSRARPD